MMNLFFSVCSDLEDESPLHKTSLNNCEKEQSSNYGNSLMSLERVFVGKSSYLEQLEQDIQGDPSLNHERSQDDTLGSIKQSIKLPLEHKVDQLESKLREAKEDGNNLRTKLHQ